LILLRLFITIVHCTRIKYEQRCKCTNVDFIVLVLYLKDYTYSKTLSEKHLLSYGNDENGGGKLEVVTLACGLVGGDCLVSSALSSRLICIAQIVQNEMTYKTLKFLEGLLGKIPLAHIDDVCEAHIFCMESTSVSGRFLCASSYISLQEMANHYARYHPEFNVKQE